MKLGDHQKQKLDFIIQTQQYCFKLAEQLPNDTLSALHITYLNKNFGHWGCKLKL